MVPFNNDICQMCVKRDEYILKEWTMNEKNVFPKDGSHCHNYALFTIFSVQANAKGILIRTEKKGSFHTWKHMYSVLDAPCYYLLLKYKLITLETH